jgi:hypothetical protein
MSLSNTPETSPVNKERIRDSARTRRLRATSPVTAPFSEGRRVTRSSKSSVPSLQESSLLLEAAVSRRRGEVGQTGMNALSKKLSSVDHAKISAFFFPTIAFISGQSNTDPTLGTHTNLKGRLSLKCGPEGTFSYDLRKGYSGARRPGRPTERSGAEQP